MHIQQNFNVKLVIVISVLSNTWNVIKGRVPEKHKRKFPGGFYSNPQSVFDKLDQFGIYAEEKDRFYVWFLVYDFEYILVPIKIKNTDNLEYTKHHVPISVSICSNVNEHRATLYNWTKRRRSRQENGYIYVNHSQECNRVNKNEI